MRLRGTLNAQTAKNSAQNKTKTSIAENLFKRFFFCFFEVHPYNKAVDSLTLGACKSAFWAFILTPKLPALRAAPDNYIAAVWAWEGYGV